MVCVAAIAMLVPGSSYASHESVQGRVGALGHIGGPCGSNPSCLAFLASNCPGDNALYKDDHHPFISVKDVAPFTAKDRTGSFRLTASQSSLPGAHSFVVVKLKTCNVQNPPPTAENDGGSVQVGQSFPVKIPKGTRWVVVYLLNPGLQDQWKLTFNHLP